MNTQQQKEIADIRAEQEKLAQRLKLLEAQAASPAKWEPKGGDFYLTRCGSIANGSTAHHTRITGSDYPTREAAESALPYVTFFKRLACLAQELNPSGKVGGSFAVGVYYGGDGSFTADPRARRCRGITCLFETREAAQRAADILNADKWQVPAL